MVPFLEFLLPGTLGKEVRTSIPPELVASVKAARSKNLIIRSDYTYPTQMKASYYAEEIELLQIEFVKMKARVKEVGERIVLILEGRDGIFAHRMSFWSSCASAIPCAGKDTDVVTPLDPHIVGSAKAIYEHGENSHSYAVAHHA